MDSSGREMTPEAVGPNKKGPQPLGNKIENFEVTDFTDSLNEESKWPEGDSSGNAADFSSLDNEEGFLQVVNKRGRGGIQSQDRGKDRGPRGLGPDKRDDKKNDNFDKKNNKSAFDRRTSKLPPRLAKQREVTRAQNRGNGPGQLSPSPGNENGWPEGDQKMGMFTVEPDIGTGAWEKPIEVQQGQTSENGSIQNTIIFENTAYKGGKSDKVEKNGSGGPIQLPLGFGKHDNDNADLKLDFTFGGEEGVLKPGNGTAPPLSIPRSLTSGTVLPASPSTDDLQTKLAGTKKLWDQPGMPAVPENSVPPSSWNPDSADLYGGTERVQTETAGGNSTEQSEATSQGEKAGDAATSGGSGVQGAGNSSSANSGHGPTVSNVAKVKPQQQQLSLDPEARATTAALQYGRMAVPSPPGSHSIPPGQLPQLHQPWAFLPDVSRTSPMFNPYSQLNQSILMPGGHSMSTDLFNSNTGHGGFRGVHGPTFPGSGGGGMPGLTTTNNVLISQASLINSGKGSHTSHPGTHQPQPGIGPIGTKAGSSSPYLANLPNTNSNIFIQYDSSGNPLNPYIQGSGPHGPGRGSTPSQTAFYQSLAAANRQHQAFNALQGFNSQAQAHQLSQLSQQQVSQQAVSQLRQGVAQAQQVQGMPFLKTQQTGDQNNKSPVSDSGFNASVPPYNAGGRSSGISGGGGPPSPKTKLKLAQAEAAKLNHNMNNLNLNNLNALAQMQRNMGLSQYNQHLGSLVQQGQYNPSPIARPQGGGSQGGAISTGAGAGGLMNKTQFFSPEGVDVDGSVSEDGLDKNSANETSVSGVDASNSQNDDSGVLQDSSADVAVSVANTGTDPGAGVGNADQDSATAVTGAV